MIWLQRGLYTTYRKKMNLGQDMITSAQVITSRVLLVWMVNENVKRYIGKLWSVNMGYLRYRLFRQYEYLYICAHLLIHDMQAVFPFEIFKLFQISLGIYSYNYNNVRNHNKRRISGHKTCWWRHSSLFQIYMLMLMGTRIQPFIFGLCDRDLWNEPKENLATFWEIYLSLKIRSGSCRFVNLWCHSDTMIWDLLFLSFMWTSCFQGRGLILLTLLAAREEGGGGCLARNSRFILGV